MQNREVSDQRYGAFTAFLSQHSGIVLGETKRYLVRSRLTSLMFEFGYQDINVMLEAILANRNRQLVQRAIEAMTTNETLWFRDSYPFDILKSAILPQMSERNRNIRIWSAACSSGQEPYSIAMSYLEFRDAHRTRAANLSITATDLSDEMIALCKAGEYDELALSRGGLTPERRQRFFSKEQGDRLKVKPEVSQLVSFRQHNLLERRPVSQTFDIVFCRNVLIYFSPEVKAKILQQFAACLSPGGILFLGASESIGEAGQQFAMVRCSPGLYYQIK